MLVAGDRLQTNQDRPRFPFATESAAFLFTILLWDLVALDHWELAAILTTITFLVVEGYAFRETCAPVRFSFAAIFLLPSLRSLASPNLVGYERAGMCLVTFWVYLLVIRSKPRIIDGILLGTATVVVVLAVCGVFHWTYLFSVCRSAQLPCLSQLRSSMELTFPLRGVGNAAPASVMLLPAAISIGMDPTSFARRLMSVVVMFALAILLALSFSRAIYISSAMICAASALIARHTLWSRARFLLFVLVFFAFLGFAGVVTFYLFGNHGALARSSIGHLHGAKEATQILGRVPLGVGTGNYLLYSNRAPQAFNALLEYLDEQGVVGAIVLSVAGLSYILVLWREFWKIDVLPSSILVDIVGFAGVICYSLAWSAPYVNFATAVSLALLVALSVRHIEEL